MNQPAQPHADDSEDFHLDWLTKNIDAAREGRIILKNVTITPNRARVAISLCRSNRKVRRAHVDNLASMLRQGGWRETHEGVAFDRNGDFRDGQHRMHACVKTGVAFQTDVHFGLDPEVFHGAVGTGMPIQIGDVLMMDGIVNSRQVAAAAKYSMLIERGTTGNAGIRMPIEEVRSWVADNPQITELHKACVPVLKGVGSSAAAAATAAIDQILKAGAQRANVNAFLEKLKTGVGLTSETDPIAKLRTHIIKRNSSGVPLAAVVIKAWNAWRQGRQIGNLAFRPDEGFPEPVA